MAHFNLENELNNVLHIDSRITKGPVARWERKALETSNLSLNKSSLNKSSLNTSNLNKSSLNNSILNKSNLNTSTLVGPTSSKLSTSKTPGTTPSLSTKKKERSNLTPGRNRTPKTPSGDSSAGDRFIPNRAAMQLEINHHLLTKGSSNDNENLTPKSQRYRDIMSENLHGDLSNHRIMAYQCKAPNDQTGAANALKILYSSTKNPGSTKRATRFIPQTPERILDAPEIIDDYYLNLLDWSCSNLLAVALSSGLYLWNASKGSIQHLTEIEGDEHYVSSVSWLPEGGSCLAFGTSLATIELWDVETEKRVRVMKSHHSRVPSLSWNSHILSSGSKNGSIHHHDVRVAEHHISTSAGHSQEVCGLRWSPDGRYLASGGNDNILNIWQLGTGSENPIHTFNDHQAAVKALAWCPWQNSILASGGGTADRHIRFWNCSLGTRLNSINTKSQVCSVLWSKEYKELASGHGFANNEIVIWKYPQMTKVTELTGHTSRVLSLCSSPDGQNMISAGADETLRLWNCFAVDLKKKKKAESIVQDKENNFMKSIR